MIGSEWDYVILCTVHSRNECDIDVKATVDWQHRYLDILTDEKLINMAVTRARKGLIIVGKLLFYCMTGNKMGHRKKVYGNKNKKSTLS